MIYPMHCTWLNRHIFFFNNTFHKKTLFLQTYDQFLTCLSRYSNAALQMVMACLFRTGNSKEMFLKRVVAVREGEGSENN